jgi:hypothetical protein
MARDEKDFKAKIELEKETPARISSTNAHKIR